MHLGEPSSSRAYVDFLAFGGLSGGLPKHTTGTNVRAPHLSTTPCSYFATAGHRRPPQATTRIYFTAKGRTIVVHVHIICTKGEKHAGEKRGRVTPV